ncbi:methyl-accepting chemotaxis protein [Pseudidiomarina planktonica]|uniref:Methyl-accepting chemotaxis protein n=1 Tax=Pseudidiomarina planktonica TaxID=1323738 RepID=A0A1Y6FYM5_9GAMM|nr:methyl-accepting chemotaxis protein [Pseudidiomarina planktonica]RUO63844.1 methyl-accepting chemotaxis protein [Pseudidiomarina planktonica]SMQ80087.1 methyl-accepting chemotaxis protein [Pseudidiomarina planktonica]
MNWFNNLKFRNKLLLPIVLLALVLVGIAGIGAYNFKNVAGNVDSIANEHLPGLNFLLQADRDLHQAQVAERSLLSTAAGSAEARRLVGVYQENIQQADERVGKFLALTTDSQSRTMVADYRAQYAAWVKTSQQVIELHDLGDPDSKQLAVELSLGESREVFDRMRNILDLLEQREEEAAFQQTELIDNIIITSTSMQVSALVVGLIICTLLALFFPRLITQPLALLLQRLDDMSKGEGDLTERVILNRKDELGLVADAFNAFVAKLQRIISQVADMTAQIATASEQLSAIAEQSNASVREQHHSVDQVATAIHEMSTTVDEISKSASDAANSAKGADRHANEGQQVVQATIAAIQELAEQVNRSAATISTVADDSNNIGTVLDVIRGIAEQTNLLALNAAIEAARAGEQGRGFSVVADEVRTLASRTQKSTAEIQDMIERLQVATQNAVKAMEVGQRDASNSVEQAQKAGASLQSITSAVAEINDMNAHIASAAEEQSTVTEEINKNISTISSISDQSAESSLQVKDASDSLAKLAADLQREVGQFKVS